MSDIDLGWNKHFENEFLEFRHKGFDVGRVVLERKTQYIIRNSENEFIARLSGRLRHHSENAKDLPCVGDWVVLKKNNRNDIYLIHHVLPRITAVRRFQTTGRKNDKTTEQVIAANIDIIFIVMGLDPDYNLNRLERYVSIARQSHTKPVIVLNKCDLVDDVIDKRQKVEKNHPNIPVYATNAHNSDDIALLRKYLSPGQTVALLGSSGVGKSTIINSFLGYERQQVGTVNNKINKGKHTTTHRELVVLPDGGILMDNPGMREIQITANKNNLLEQFSEIETLAKDCRFRNCTHVHEPDCAVKLAVSNGVLGENKYQNYVKLLNEAD